MRHVDTIVLVRNIAESKNFYSGVMQLEVLHDWGSMVVFKNRLALHQIDLLQPKDLMGSLVNVDSVGSGNLIIYIGTSNLAEDFRKLENSGVEIVHGIVDLPWQRIFRVKDNDGNIVEVGEEEDT